MVRQITEFDTADNLDIYPESDGQPMADNTLQFSWIVLIKEGLEILFATVLEVFVAGDLLWYRVKDQENIKRLEAEERAQLAEERANMERQARINAAAQLLQTGMSIEQVAQILSLTLQEVEHLRNL